MAAQYEPPYLDLPCLQIQLFSFLALHKNFFFFWGGGGGGGGGGDLSSGSDKKG